MKQALFVSFLSCIFGTVSAQQTEPILSWDFEKIDKTEKVKPLTRKGLPTPEVDRAYFVSEEKMGVKGQY